MARRSTLWIPFQTGSNTLAGGTQSQVVIDTNYASQAAAQFKGTILAVKGYLTYQQTVPSNTYETFAAGIMVADAGMGATVPDLFTAITKLWLWYISFDTNGPGGDTTAQANVMSPFMFPIDARSKRIVGFQDSIVVKAKSDGDARFAMNGRILVLEA